MGKDPQYARVVEASEAMDEAIAALKKAKVIIDRPPDRERGEFFPKANSDLSLAEKRVAVAHFANAKEAASRALDACALSMEAAD